MNVIILREADGETKTLGANIIHLLGLVDVDQTIWQLCRYRDRRIEFHTLAAALLNKKAKYHTAAARLNKCEWVSLNWHPHRHKLLRRKVRVLYTTT